MNRSWFSFKRSETPLNEVTLCLCLSKLVLTDRAHLTSHHVPPKRAATHVHLSTKHVSAPEEGGCQALGQSESQHKPSAGLRELTVYWRRQRLQN